MEISNLIPHIEALIFASDKPLTSVEITELINQAFGFMEDKIVIEQVEASLQGIVEKYSSEFYPFEIRQSGGGWQFLTKKEFHKTVAQLNGEKFLKKLSAAALETLAIIAYKQPITKGEIEAIRGVSSDYSVQKLLEKELIVITGRNEKLPGHPLVYSTSKTFMDYFGLNSPEDMPKIREVLTDQIVEPTIVNHTDFEQSETLAVSDTGELLDVATAEGGEEQHLNGHSFKELDPDTVDEPGKNEEAARNGEPDITHQANNETIDEEGATEEDIETARLFIDDMHDEEIEEDAEETLDDEDADDADNITDRADDVSENATDFDSAASESDMNDIEKRSEEEEHLAEDFDNEDDDIEDDEELYEEDDDITEDENEQDPGSADEEENKTPDKEDGDAEDKENHPE
jgi:segregation and condensation protein B